MSENNDPVLAWLLEEDNPSVRYFALKWLVGAGEDDGKVKAARKAIMKSGIVPAILERQNLDGSWGEPDSFYTDKYGGTAWQLLVLAEAGADPRDPRIRRAGDFLLSVSQDLESGGFSVHRAAKTGGGRASEVIPCLTGNMVFSLLTLGMGDDERVKAGLDWIGRYQRCDDGEGEVPKGWPYDRYEMCWGRHSCHQGVVKALKALAAVPEERRGKRERDTIASAVEYFLRHRVHMRSHEPDKVAKPGWLKLGFPLMYQSDILEILGLLAGLGIRDGRMEGALAALRSKRSPEGTWKLESSMNGKMLVDVEKKGQASKWITLRALRVLHVMEG